MVPSGLCLIVKTQRHPTGFFPEGRTLFSHVLFFIRAPISSSIAFFQFCDFKACSIVLGISSLYKDEVKACASLEKLPMEMFAMGYLDDFGSFSRE
ncbi:hypothetical protein Hanom_Chr07g00590911 [Helianthus anomalus]